MSDIINHPAHYTASRETIEPIDLCEALPFCLGNAVKYICRAGLKEGAAESTDLKKAAWYLSRYIGQLSTGKAGCIAASPRATAAYLLLTAKHPMLYGLLHVEECGVLNCETEGVGRAFMAVNERLAELENEK